MFHQNGVCAAAASAAGGEIHALLLEEPENHLSHVSMKRLVNQLATERQTQVFIATHSSHISSRLDLRKAILLGATRVGY